jgi:hypothetical protein
VQASHDANSKDYWVDKTKVYDNQSFMKSLSFNAFCFRELD